MKVRVASAGTGKTTALVREVLGRIAAGTPLRRIAAVTFTRAAAAELRDRIGDGLREAQETGAYLQGLDRYPDSAAPRFREAAREVSGAVLTTIHGFMAECLRIAAPQAGLDPDFRTLPEWEAQAAFEEELRGLAYLAAAGDADVKTTRAFDLLGDEAVPLAGSAFAARSLLTTFEAAAGDERAAALAQLVTVAAHRTALRNGGTRLAPPEIERRAVALAGNREATARVAARHPLVLVDEYQDVNPLQGRFFTALEAAEIEIIAVGDPKQSIYGFRHADVEVFRRAARDGELLPPLTESRRHAQVVTRFLNALTGSMAARGLGFLPDEAPAVTSAGPQAERQGGVEIHWVTGDTTLAEIRRHEAEVIAERLAAHADAGTPTERMAVLARAHHALTPVRDALLARGIPVQPGQGRNYYERSEVRDLVTALRVGIDASDRAVLASWARGPFGGLTVTALDALLQADDPLAWLREHEPDRAEAIAVLADAASQGPTQALRTAATAPLLPGGERFVRRLGEQARANVDALLFEVAERPPADVELLLQRLDAMAQRAREAGDVPSEGENGVHLVTAHASKGLEWSLVAVCDLTAGGRNTAPPVLIHEQRLHLPGGPGAADALAAHRARERQERFRLLYVAASRARDRLLLSGSLRDGKEPSGWASALQAMGLGPDARERRGDRFRLQLHRAPAGATAPPVSADRPPVAPPAAPHSERRFAPAPWPPVASPSQLQGSAADASEPAGEPWRDGGFGGPEGTTPRPGPRLPGRGVTVGTLLHDAIRRDADPDDPATWASLRAQEVMFPYDEAQQQALLAEVKDLLRGYHALLGGPLPTLARRQRDLKEWPVLLPDGPRTWYGVIDRLYLVDGAWFLDDYKTDRTMHRARYAFQAAVYRRAVAEAFAIRPQVRLVDLWAGRTLPFCGEELDTAWAGRSDAP